MDLYHSRLTPNDLNDLIIKYKIPHDLQPRLSSEDFVMSELLDDAIGSTSLTKRRAPSLVYIDDNRSCMKQWKSRFFFIDRQAIPDAMVWIHPDTAIDDPRPSASSFNMADVRRLSAHVIKLRDMPEVMGIYDFLSLPEWTGVEVQEEPHLDVRSTLQRLPFYCTPPATVDAVIPKPTPKDLAVGTLVLRFSTTRPSLFVGDDDESDDDEDACVEIMLVTPLHSATVIPSSGNQGGSSAPPTAEDSRGKGVIVDDAAPSAGASRSRPSSRPTPSFRDVFGDAIHMDFFPFSAGPYYATYPMDGVARNCEFTREEWDAPYRLTFGVLTKEVFKDPVVWKTIVDQFPTPREMVRVKSLFNEKLTAKMSVLHCMMMLHSGELLARYHGLNQSHHEYVLSTDSRMKGYEEKVASLTGLELQVSALKKQVSGLNDKLSSSNASFAKSKAKGKERKKKIKSLTKSVYNLHSEVPPLSTSLNQATVLEAEKDEEILRLKTNPSEFSSFFRGQFQGLVRKFLASDKFSRVQGELLFLANNAGFERGLSLLKPPPFSLKLIMLFSTRSLSMLLEPLSVILQLEPEKLVRPANVTASREVRVSPPIKESTVTPVSKSLELSTNVNFTASAIDSEHNGEMVNVEVDGSDPKMTDDTAIVKFGHAFVQGISVALDDAMELVEVGLGYVSFGPNDVVVALSAHEKGDGLDPLSYPQTAPGLNTCPRA
ncbi:hypothetical protein Tco_0765153 [Tanacetum coccineum]